MKYEAIAPVSVHTGALVKLSKTQAVRVVGLVEAVDDPKGWSRVIHPFQFKAGETFETDIDFGKGYANAIEDAKSKAAREKAAAAEETERKKAEAEDAARLEAERKKAEGGGA